VLERGEQDFSFLYRTFVFKRGSAAPLEEAPAEEEVPDPAAESMEEAPAEDAADVEKVEDETPAVPGKLTARHAGLRIQGRLLAANKSPYSLDNPEHVRLLFSKDWRIAAAEPAAL
jgi:hypothetical protein